MTDDETGADGTTAGTETGAGAIDGTSDETTRRARIETTHGDPETARQVARAISPDNTTEMQTQVDGDRIVTVIERDSTGGLQTTVDDYVVNLQTAVQLATQDRASSTTETRDT